MFVMPSPGGQPTGQFGGRTHTNLGKHARPMYLDGTHGNVQLIGNHCVELARRYAVHDLLLTLAQARQARQPFLRMSVLRS